MSVLPKNHREWLNCGCLGLVLRRYERRGMSAKCVTGDMTASPESQGPLHWAATQAHRVSA